MTSVSSSKNDSTLGSRSAEKDKSPSPEENILNLRKLRESFQGLIRRAIKSDWSPALRETVGFLSCMCVLVFVAGHTSGSWVYRMKDRVMARFVKP